MLNWRRLKLWMPFAIIVGGLTLVGSLAAFQSPWREYPAVEYNTFPAPEDYDQPAEFIFARLMYPAHPYARFDRAGSRWAEGYSSWTQDYPRADRHFMTALRRLTRLEVRSVEQAVNLDVDDDVFNYPFLYAVRPGEWQLTSSQIEKMRDFFDRGGFFMTDDFWGTQEWDYFMYSMEQVFPEAEVVDIPESDPFFSIMYEIPREIRYQIPGMWGVGRGGFGGRRGGFGSCVTAQGYGCQNDGNIPYWRAIYVKDRIVAAIIPNSDLGDSWEYADDPTYPEMFSRLGLRLGMNAIMYSMTH